MEIYLIQTNPSGYEEHSEILGFKTTEEEAKLAVAELIDSYCKAKKFQTEVLGPAKSEFNRTNPISYVPLCAIPKWPAGISHTVITPEMRQEREDIKNKNQNIIEQNSRTEVERLKRQMKFLSPLIQPVLNEPWFKKWFEINERFTNCSAHGLTEGAEYFYEACEEFKPNNPNN